MREGTGSTYGERRGRNSGSHGQLRGDILRRELTAMTLYTF